MNKKRQEIWNKSGGKCWYCGCDLPEKGWHADHFEPVFRYNGSFDRPERDNKENLVPACAPCNLFKSTFTIELFREQIENQIERGRRSSVNFRTAERFGLIEVTSNPVVFWFEENIKDE